MQSGHKKKQRFFTSRELRLSIMMIVLVSFFSAVLFMYLVKMFGGALEDHSVVAFVLVMVGYAAIVGFLTALFTHRFVGPFERLRYELGMVVAGDFKRRLKVRQHDDAYLRSFIEDVNRVLALLEENRQLSAEVQREIFAEISTTLNKMEEGPRKKELAALRDRIAAHLR